MVLFLPSTLNPEGEATSFRQVTRKELQKHEEVLQAHHQRLHRASKRKSSSPVKPLICLTQHPLVMYFISYGEARPKRLTFWPGSGGSPDSAATDAHRFLEDAAPDSIYGGSAPDLIACPGQDAACGFAGGLSYTQARVSS